MPQLSPLKLKDIDKSMLNLDTSFLKFDLQQEINNNSVKLKEILSDLKSRQADQSDWVGWLNLHEDKSVFDEVQAYADQVIASGKFDNLVLLGIGGSSLGPIALFNALYSPRWNEMSPEERNDGLKMYFLDNVDPDWTEGILSGIDYSRTLFCTITKSGGTAETISTFLSIREKLINNGLKWQDHCVFITDPVKGNLRQMAEAEGVKSFAVPPHVGGRFSVFSPVGLVPLALAGTDIMQMHSALAQAYANCVESDSVDSPAMQLAVALYHADKNMNRHMNVLMPYSTHLSRVADWYVQLTAESLGKSREVGPTPIKAVGATDQHSQLQLFSDGPHDKVIFFIKVANFAKKFPVPSEAVAGFERLAGINLEQLIQAEHRGTAAALNDEGVPNLTIELDSINEESIAYLLYTFELMTAIAGGLYGIDPFNQPGVELSKKYTYQFLAEDKVRV